MGKYNQLEFGNITYLVSDEISSDKEKNFYEAYFDRESILKSQNVELRGGRGQTILYKKDGEDLVLRHYKRGGMLGKVIADLFFKFEPHSHRAADEFRLLLRMQSLGLPVPEPVIAREEHALLHLRQDIVIKRLNGYQDLSYILKKRALRAEEYELLGRTVRRFFDAGILHTDLNIRNILMNEQGDICIIDFDKCFEQTMTTDLRVNVIERLKRSFIKEKTNKKIPQENFCEASFKSLEKSALYNAIVR
ncbi:MAG: 3-deoxy-D-manno-octulosonic acid kinase [Succinivibrio sp.]